MQKNIFSVCEINPSVRPSFAETLEKVKVQIDYECFPTESLALAFEIAQIIADVYRMHPEDRIKIENAMRTVSDVRAVYAQLEYEHVDSVIQKFREIPYRVKSPSRYLRSMLYKEVLEYNLAEENLLRTIGGDGI